MTHGDASSYYVSYSARAYNLTGKPVTICHPSPKERRTCAAPAEVK